MMENYEEVIASLPGKEFKISRVFDAPRDMVFKAWTDAEHLAKWWGPKGFEIVVNKLEFKPGGIFHYSMEVPGMPKSWGRFIYRDIAESERIVFINSFSDEDGGITRAPFAQDWPLEMYNVVTFTEDEGKTILTIRGKAYNATEEERKTYEDNFGSMQQGFGGTMDQLEQYLANA